MTHQEKLKVLKVYFKAKYDVNASESTLEMFLPDYVFTDDGQILHIDELPEQEDLSKPETEIDDPDYLEDKTSVNFEIDEREKLESIEEFTKRYPHFTIVKSRYFRHKKRWLIFGYEKSDDLYDRYSCLTWSDNDSHNLANSTYGRCLTTFQEIEKDLQYISHRQLLKTPDLSEYYGTYYTRKQLNLLEV